MTETFFFDTYAFIEVIKGNENYKRYSNSNPITAIFNIKELYYILLKDFGKDIADLHVDKYVNFVVEAPLWVIKKAMEFKLLHKKENLSYTDCIGYILAIKSGIKFLTGDSKFKDRQNVEFVR